ncbi:MAG: hypothetical protein KJ811_04520, partial [Candidatus Margulisbacteria bacterium]|nr:hypothetical protein [Candidatus Margulisiibacteriota bacterium]
MNILASSGLAIFITSIGTAIFVYLNNPRQQTHIVWSLFCLAVSMWGWGLFWGFVTNNANEALFWGRFLNVSAIFIPMFFLHFVYAFLEIAGKKKSVLLFSYLATFFYIVFTLIFPDLFVEGVVPRGPFLFYPSAGALYYFFPILYSALVLLGISNLLKAYKQERGQKRNQINYLFWGMAIGFAGGATTFPYVFSLDLYPFGTWGVIVYVVLVAYAITKHDLMDIRVIINKTVAWVLTVVLLGGVYLGLTWLYIAAVGQQIGVIFPVLTVLYGILVGEVFQKVRLFLQTTGARKFIKGFYDSDKVTNIMAEKLAPVFSIEDTVEIIADQLKGQLEIDEIVIYLAEKQDGKLPHKYKVFAGGDEFR